MLALVACSKETRVKKTQQGQTAPGTTTPPTGQIDKPTPKPGDENTDGSNGSPTEGGPISATIMKEIEPISVTDSKELPSKIMGISPPRTEFNVPFRTMYSPSVSEIQNDGSSLEYVVGNAVAVRVRMQVPKEEELASIGSMVLKLSNVTLVTKTGQTQVSGLQKICVVGTSLECKDLDTSKFTPLNLPPTAPHQVSKQEQVEVDLLKVFDIDASPKGVATWLQEHSTEYHSDGSRKMIFVLNDHLYPESGTFEFAHGLQPGVMSGEIAEPEGDDANGFFVELLSTNAPAIDPPSGGDPVAAAPAPLSVTVKTAQTKRGSLIQSYKTQVENAAKAIFDKINEISKITIDCNCAHSMIGIEPEVSGILKEKGIPTDKIVSGNTTLSCGSGKGNLTLSIEFAPGATEQTRTDLEAALQSAQQ